MYCLKIYLYFELIGVFSSFYINFHHICVHFKTKRLQYLLDLIGTTASCMTEAIGRFWHNGFELAFSDFGTFSTRIQEMLEHLFLSKG